MKIHSSNIQNVEYDPEQKVLEVTFNNGGVYAYHGVTPEIYAAFIDAPSRGGFLHNVIKPACPVEPKGRR